MRILIVDDEVPSRRMFRLALEDQHELHEAGDGASALEVMHAQGPFDVVLLDLRMPGMTGFETLNRIHQLSPQTAVIVITAHSSLAVAAEAMRAGAKHFLSKPTDPKSLRAAVAATRRKVRPPGPDAPTSGVTMHHDTAITLNGFTVEPSGEAVRVERDGSAVHSFHVSHALESWEQVVSVRLGPRALQRTVARQKANDSALAGQIARRALAEHLWREGLLPSKDGLVVEEADATLVAAVLSEVGKQ
jgi:CheY-like chemotaxis protein